jgi:hypothetical protein
MQSRKYSAMETMTNVLAGYALALCSQVVVFPTFGIHVSMEASAVLSLWFTVASMVPPVNNHTLLNGGGNPVKFRTSIGKVLLQKN